MHSSSKDHLIAFVGMPGAGKSSAVAYLESLGYPSVYFGGITVAEVKRRGLEVNEANEKAVREELRAIEGPDVMAKRIATQVEHLVDAGQHRVVADGLYSWDEYKFFKQHFAHKVTIIAIVAPRHVRHLRLAKRPVRPLNEADVTGREYAQIEHLNQGGPIANADYYIANSYGLNELHQQLDELLVKIGFASKG